MKKKVMVIVNPIAGSGRGERFLNRLEQALDGTEFETVLYRTSHAGHAFNAAKKAGDFATLVCIGGDGTVNEIINGLMNSKHNSVPVGFLPTGSGNVIAKELNISRNIKQLVNLLKEGKSRDLDVGRVSFPQTGIQRHFISMAGIGFDAEITRIYREYRKDRAILQAHLFSYLPLALRRVITYRLPRMRLEVDGKLVSTNASFVQVANARNCGGPFVLVNQASPDDGWLDVLWFTGYAPRDILRYYWNAIWRTVDRCVDAHHTRAKKVGLSPLKRKATQKKTSTDQIHLQVDGDWCGSLPAEIEILPQAISFLTPLKQMK